MYDFLNSNLFLSIITLTVGTIAFIVYLKGKRDHKREAASVILMELRQAENFLKNIRNNPVNIDISNSNFQLNNWNKYGYLFTTNLDNDEIDSINDFYNGYIIIMDAIRQLSSVHQTEVKSASIQNIIAQIAKESESEEIFKKKKDQTLSLLYADTTVFIAQAPGNVINKQLNIIKSVLTTSAGVKLKKIAK